uniref:Putative virion core protein n=1 Tax=viral metagenome TaxID=1070528 RepID=A0A6M3IJ21_9ZZZZ
MALRDIDIYRQNLRPSSRFGNPYLRQGLNPLQTQQAGPKNWWQWLTPWKEEKGENFLTGVGDVFRSVGTPFAAPILRAQMTPQEKAKMDVEWNKDPWSSMFGKESSIGQKYEEMPWWAKLAAETPAFLLGGGIAGAGIKGLGSLGARAGAGAATRGAARLGQAALTPLGGGGKGVFQAAGKAGGLSGRAAQAISAPMAGMEAATGAVLGGAGKLGMKALEKVLPLKPGIVAGKIVLPSSQMLDARFVQDFPRRLAQWAESKPLLNKVVQAVGGKSAFIRPASGEPKDIVMKELVKRDVVLGMRSSVQGFYMPKLQRYGDPMKLLKISEKGVVGATKQKGYLYDVLENPKNYTFLDDMAKQYVDDVRGIVDDIYQLAGKEGVKHPDDIIIHRIVKGKNLPKGFEEAEFGSFFERERFYKTMKEGVDAGMEYGLNPNESVMSTINHYIKRIGDERLKKAVKPFRLKGSASLAAGARETSIHPAFIRKAYAGKQVIGEGEEAVTKVFTKMRPGVFPSEVVKVAENYLKDEGQRWLKGVSEVSGVGRLLVAAMDFSAPFIQGLPILGRRPDVWAKATAKHYGFFIQPKNLYKYMTDPAVMATRTERILYGGSSSPFEFFEALAPVKKGITAVAEKARVPQVGKVIAKGIEQSYGRAEAAFTGFGEMARNEMWKALKRPNMSESQLTELATVIDRMTGTMSTEALGLGLSQRQFESAFMFFAPRYTRAGLTLVSDVFKGGLTGAEARKALGGVMAGGAAMYTGICKALGQEPNFDPSTGEFMTIKVGDDHIGIGGMITSLARLGADVIATTAENPMDLFMPFKDKRLNRWDNPFIKFLYSRAAPFTSLTVGAAVENADYFGRPMEDLSDWARFLADKVTPIATQRIAPWAEETVTPLGIAGELTGMRTWGERKVITPEQQKRVAYQEIEDKVWGQYPTEYININSEVNKLEQTDKYRAKRLLMQYPGLVMARKRIDIEKRRWLLQSRRLSA